jgi:hypothetical protein
LPRPKIVRLVEVIKAKGEYGTCSCGGSVVYYTDAGVKCSECGKLYGLWYTRRVKQASPEPNQPRWEALAPPHDDADRSQSRPHSA